MEVWEVPFGERHIPMWRLIGRGALRRCARCGEGGLFRRWFTMATECPRCKLTFEREQGYWLGAMTLNFAITEAAFLVVLVATMVATWPDVPWGRLLVGVLVTNLVVPLVFYPFSKTIWVGLERGVRSRLDAAG